MKITTVLWDVMLCSLIEDYQYFEATCHLYLQPIFYPEDGGATFLYILPNCMASHPRRY
jgi:hypothetical protein